MGNYPRPTGWAVRRKSDGAWMADKQGRCEFVHDQFDWDIVVSPRQDEAEEWAAGDPGLEVTWKGVGFGSYPDGAIR